MVLCVLTAVAVLAVVVPVGSPRAASVSVRKVSERAGLKVIASGACRRLHVTASGLTRLPPLVATDAPPGSRLQSILSIAREPAAGDGLAQIRGFDRWPLMVLTVFKRYIQIVNGERGTRLAFFPAVFCNQTPSGPAFTRSEVTRITPAQGVLMVVLSNPGPSRPGILAGTPATIRTGPALPGLDLATGRGWIQATVVPDGVARVVMHFTPPFLHHYTATASIHDNIGVIVRNPDYTPTTVSWYAASGRLIRTFVNKREIRTDQCLAHHRKHCLGP